jgi:hypothetical protein
MNKLIKTLLILTLLALPAWGVNSSLLYPDSSSNTYGPQVWDAIQGQTTVNLGDTIDLVQLKIRKPDVNINLVQCWNGYNWVTTFPGLALDATLAPEGAVAGGFMYSWEYNSISSADFIHGEDYSIFYRTFDGTTIITDDAHLFTWDAEGPTGTPQVQNLIPIGNKKFVDPNVPVLLLDLSSAQDDYSGVAKMKISFSALPPSEISNTGPNPIPYTLGYLYDISQNNGDGTYRFVLELIDGVDNSTPGILGEEFIIDTTPPEVTDLSFDHGRALSNFPAIGLEQVDACGVGYFTIYKEGVALPDQIVNSDPDVTVIGGAPLFVTQDGEYQIEIISYDRLGNHAPNPIPLGTFVYDTTQPDLAAHFPQEPVYASEYLLVGNAGDLNGVEKVEVSLNNGPFVQVNTNNNFHEWEYNLTNLPNGPIDIAVKATDNAGNHYTINASCFVQTLVPPEIEISSPADGTAVNTTQLEIEGSASDDYFVTEVELSVDGAVTQVFTGSDPSVSFNPIATLTAGKINPITVNVTDDSLNTAQATIHVTCDLDPPALFNLIKPAHNGITPASPEFIWEASHDDLSGIMGYDLYINNAKVNAELLTDVSYTLPTALSDGILSYFVVAWDKAGNPTQSDTWNFQVDGTPSGAFNLITPTEGQYVEDAFEVAWTESIDADSGLAAYEVYLDGEKIAETGPNNTSVQITEVPEDGILPVYVVARDAAGNTTSSNTTSIVANPYKPDISLRVNGLEIANSDTISCAPHIQAQISDNSGIDPDSIKIMIDGQVQESPSLLAIQAQASSVTAYDATSNNNRRLEPGKHSIMVEAKDVYGKKATAKVENLEVATGVALEGPPKNYPNPVRFSYGQITNIVYTLTNDADITIKIFDLAGGLQRSIFCPAGSPGGQVGTNEVPWDGTDERGKIVGNGVNIYFITSEGRILTHGTGGIATLD